MLKLPDFPWDLVPYGWAAARPDGMVDLSVGTPVDPTPKVIARRCLGGRRTGLPAPFHGTALRGSVAAYFRRRWGIDTVDPDGVLPTIGSKELVAWLPTLLGLGPGDTVVYPTLAYPTYDVGARWPARTPLLRTR